MEEERTNPFVRGFLILLAIGAALAMMASSPSFGGWGQLAAIVGGAIVLILLAAWGTVLAIGREIPDEEYKQMSRLSDELARYGMGQGEPTEFDRLVMEALDDLPEQFQEVLAETPVLVSDLGQENQAYGHYMGDTVARGNYPNRIVIYRDTLTRDFGHDPDMLRAQVTRTVRHEIAHHLGWDEQGVRDLGL